MSMPSTDSQQRPTDNAPVGAAELFELAPVPQTWAVLGPDGQASAWQGNAAWRDLFDNAAPWLDPLAQIGFVR